MARETNQSTICPTLLTDPSYAHSILQVLDGPACVMADTNQFEIFPHFSPFPAYDATREDVLRFLQNAIAFIWGQHPDSESIRTKAEMWTSDAEELYLSSEGQFNEAFGGPLGRTLFRKLQSLPFSRVCNFDIVIY